jgi:hypothetical protein
MDVATTQYLIALGVVVLGVCGWFVPYKWNPLRLRHPYSKYVSEYNNMAIAKVLGALLIVFGLFMAVLTVAGEDLITRP